MYFVMATFEVTTLVPIFFTVLFFERGGLFFIFYLAQGFSWLALRHGEVRAAVFLHALTIVCVFHPIYLHNLRNYSMVFSGNDALRLGILHLLH